MSFEPHLRPAFDSLSARLRDDMERQLNAAVQELAEQASKIAESAAADRDAVLADAVAAARTEAEQSAQDRHQVALSDAEYRHREALGQTEQRHRETLQETEARHRESVGELESRHRDAVGQIEQRLAQQIEEHRGRLEEHRSQLERTAREHEARLGRAIADTESRIHSSLQAADLAAGGRLVEAFRAIDNAQSLSDILNALSDGVAAEAERSAIFLAGNAQVKSWRAYGFSTDAAIEVPTVDSGIIATALDSKEAVSTTGDGGDDAVAKAPAFAELPDDRAAIAVPMIVNEEVVAVVYADQGTVGDVERPSWPAVVEVIARHASRSLEAITAHRLAKTLGSGATRPRTVAKPADVVSSPAPAVRVATPTASAVASAEVSARPVAVLEIDEESAAAQRYARSLIADIRSMHEADVAAGVRERDLMTRLGGPIARAWALYEARVPESIRTATNFFHAEMVRTLADGDASLLTPRE